MNKDKEPLMSVIPKNSKEYVFNGSFGTFKTIAISEKSALKKFNKWRQSNNQ